VVKPSPRHRPELREITALRDRQHGGGRTDRFEPGMR